MNLNTVKLNIGWYRNTHGQVPSAHIKHYLLSKEYGGLSGQNPWAGDNALTDSTQVTSPTYEQKQYYYHPTRRSLLPRLVNVFNFVES